MNRLTDYKTSPPKETNFQHYEKEIRAIGELDQIAKSDGRIYKCFHLECEDCDFNDETCNTDVIDWLYSEYKEDTRITNKECNFLLAIEKGCIVRDGHDNLFWYEYPPSNVAGIWEDNGGDVVKLNFMTNLQFPFIKHGVVWFVETLLGLEVK